MRWQVCVFCNIQVLFQVFVAGTKSECKPLLQTVLKNQRFCALLSPYFTPAASPEEFVTLYEKVVSFLSEDNSGIICMLLTKARGSCDQAFAILWISMLKPGCEFVAVESLELERS